MGPKSKRNRSTIAINSENLPPMTEQTRENDSCSERPIQHGRFSVVDDLGNVQDILKASATIAMILDHLGWCIFRDVRGLRVIGRISLPLFSFFGGYNTGGIKPPRRNILFVGLLLSIFLNGFFRCYLVRRMPIQISQLFTIYFGQWCFYLVPESRPGSRNTPLLISYLIPFFLVSMLSFIGTRTESFDLEFGPLPFLGMITGRLSRNGQGYTTLVRICIGIFLILYWQGSVHNLNFDSGDAFKSAFLMVLVFLALTRAQFEYASKEWSWFKQISRNTLYLYAGSIIFPHCFLGYGLSLRSNN